MIIFTESKKLKDAARNLIDTYYDELDAVDLPGADDFDDNDLILLANICLHLDGSLDFIIESKDSKLIFSEMLIAFNSEDYSEKVELTLTLEKAAVDYYRNIIDEIIQDVAEDIFYEAFDN